MDTHRALAAACLLLVGAAAAAEPPTFPVSIHVDSRGLDLSRAADAQKFYFRLKRGAWEVCNGRSRVGLQPEINPDACIETALGDAIRSADKPLVTQVYLASHSVREAAAHGIDAPQMASLSPPSAAALRSP